MAKAVGKFDWQRFNLAKLVADDSPKLIQLQYALVCLFSLLMGQSS